MAEKLDLGRAWNEATALLGANKDVVLIVAAVFFFLPNAISTLMLPPQDMLIMQLEALGDQPDLEELMAVFADYLGQSWWIWLLFALVQAVGVLGLLALLTDRARPTVGEALVFGGKALPSYLVSQILMGLIMVAVPFLLIVLGALISEGIAVLMAFVGVVLMVYIWVKFSLLSPVIAIDKMLNPVRALHRSWSLTKGNSLRVLAFFLLLILAMAVLSAVVGMALTLFTVLGDEIGLFAAAIGNGLVSMAFTTVMLGVLASIHRQLSGGSAKGVRQTFE